MRRAFVEARMIEKGYVTPSGQPDWPALARDLGLSPATVVNHRNGCGKPIGRPMKRAYARTLDLDEETIWPSDSPAERGEMLGDE